MKRGGAETGPQIVQSRKKVPYRAEALWQLSLRRQEPSFYPGQGFTHGVPETQEQIAEAKAFTARMKDLLKDDGLGGRLKSAVVSLADDMLADGHITEEQYLEVLQIRFGELKTPKVWVLQYGSVYDRAEGL